MFTSTNGRVACERHIGNYAQSVLQKKPTANRITTPLDVWHRMTADDLNDWLEFLRESNTTEACESCRKEHVNV